MNIKLGFKKYKYEPDYYALSQGCPEGKFRTKIIRDKRAIAGGHTVNVNNRK